jgi:SAM-dependent methyltransferase
VNPGAFSHGASFRDPSGFIFRRKGTIFRQVNRVFEPHYRRFVDSGLQEELLTAGLLLPYEEQAVESGMTADAWLVLEPEPVELISYPWEWSFSQRKDAALATLEIARRARQKGMVLKDANAFNIQFYQGRPVLIDHLSFEIIEEGEPWVAYHQFCEQFLAPLALMALVDVRLGIMLRSHTGGIPLDLASLLLPTTSKLKLGLLAHIHGHAKARSGDGEKNSGGAKMSETSHIALLDNLQSTVASLSWKPSGTVWADYYSNTNYSNEAMEEKKRMVRDFIRSLDSPPATCWDLGANTGEFSMLAADMGIETTAWDFDTAAVEKGFLAVKERGITNLLPLIQDFSNPTPRLGWDLSERDSFADRGPADVVLALALLHHLAIANNVPLLRIADWLSGLGRAAIVEFVPKSDSQVKRLLSSRKDVFSHYDQASFEDAMGRFFDLIRKEPIPGTERTLYLFRRSE